MRRPIFIIFAISLLFSFFYTNNYKDNFSNLENNRITISGIIKDINYKEKYNEYRIGKFLVRDFNKKQKLPLGYKVIVNGKFNCLDNLKLDEFDYGRYLRSIGYVGVLNLEKFSIENENKSIYYFSNKSKEIVQERLIYIFKNYSYFCSALILGTKTDIDKETLDSFSKTGTAHIIALSGFNVGIIVLALSFLMRGINKLYKFVFISAVLIFYSFIGNLTPSIIRASVFAIIMYMSLFIEREYDAICALSFVGTFFIIQNPFVVYSISFQLSFLATLSIIYFYNIIDKYLKYPLVSLTISATILTWPIIYYNFKIFSIISLIANILVVPAIGIITNLILICLFVSIINLKVTILISHIGTILIEYIFLVVDYLSNIKYAYIEFKSANLQAVVIYYIVIILYMTFREIKIVKEQKNGVQGYS